MEKKIALVCSGGGMRCAFAAGALSALAREYQFKAPDILIAASGSAGFSLYYLAEQYEAIYRIATDLVSVPAFITYPRLWKIMDIDYLIDTIFKKQAPLEVQKAQAAATEYYIATTDTETRAVRYLLSTTQ